MGAKFGTCRMEWVKASRNWGVPLKKPRRWADSGRAAVSYTTRCFLHSLPSPPLPSSLPSPLPPTMTTGYCLNNRWLVLNNCPDKLASVVGAAGRGVGRRGKKGAGGGGDKNLRCWQLDLVPFERCQGPIEQQEERKRKIQNWAFWVCGSVVQFRKLLPSQSQFSKNLFLGRA